MTVPRTPRNPRKRRAPSGLEDDLQNSIAKTDSQNDEATINQLSLEVSKLRTDNERLQKDNSHLESIEMTLRDTITSLEGSVRSSEGTIISLGENVNYADQIIESLRRNITHSDNKIESLESLNLSFQITVSTLETQLRSLRNTNTNLESAYTAASEDISKLSSRLKHANEEIPELLQLTIPNRNPSIQAYKQAIDELIKADKSLLGRRAHCIRLLQSTAIEEYQLGERQTKASQALEISLMDLRKRKGMKEIVDGSVVLLQRRSDEELADEEGIPELRKEIADCGGERRRLKELLEWLEAKLVEVEEKRVKAWRDLVVDLYRRGGVE